MEKLKRCPLCGGCVVLIHIVTKTMVCQSCGATIGSGKNKKRLCAFCGDEIDEFGHCQKCHEIVAPNEWEGETK